MAKPAYAHDALLPQPTGGTGPGVALALLAHAGLLLALTTVVDWRTQSPEVVAAELWASVPQTAAPRPDSAVPPPAPTPTPAPAPPPPAPPPPAPPPPAPPPPKPVPVPAPPPPAAKPPPAPDIAEQRAEQKRKAEAVKREADAEAERERERERERAAEDKRRQVAQQAAEKAEREAKAKAEEERVAKQREENLRRMMSQAGTGTEPRGTAAADAAPSANYLALLRKRIYENLVFTGAVDDAARAEVEVRVAPGGTILSSRLVRPSGHPQWDEAVMRAIDKTGRLPADNNGRVPGTLILVFRPRE